MYLLPVCIIKSLPKIHVFDMKSQDVSHEYIHAFGINDNFKLKETIYQKSKCFTDSICVPNSMKYGVELKL